MRSEFLLEQLARQRDRIWPHRLAGAEMKLCRAFEQANAVAVGIVDGGERLLHPVEEMLEQVEADLVPATVQQLFDLVEEIADRARPGPCLTIFDVVGHPRGCGDGLLELLLDRRVVAPGPMRPPARCGASVPNPSGPAPGPVRPVPPFPLSRRWSRTGSVRLSGWDALPLAWSLAARATATRCLHQPASAKAGMSSRRPDDRHPASG